MILIDGMIGHSVLLDARLINYMRLKESLKV